MFVSFFHCNCLVLFSTIHFSSSQQVGFGYHHLVKMSPEGLYCLLWVFSIRTLDFFEAFEAHENLFFLGILHSPSVCDTRPQSLARLSVIILFCCLYLSTCRVTKHPILLGTISCLALKVPFSRKPLSPGQTKRVGHPNLALKCWHHLDLCSLFSLLSLLSENFYSLQRLQLFTRYQW